MKMPEKRGHISRHSRGKGTRHQAILAFAMAYLRGRYNGGAFLNSNRHNDVRHYRLVHS